MERLRFKDENNEISKIHLKVLSEVLEKGSKKPVKDKAKYKRITVKLHLKGIEETEPVSYLKDTRPFYQRFNNEIIIGKQNYFNGSVAIVPEKYDGAICSNAIMSFKAKNIDTNYLFYQISRRDFLKKREMLANGTGQKELSEKDFLNFKVEVPSKLEQEKIGGFLSAFDRLIDKQREKVELLKKSKKGYTQQIFNRTLRFKDENGNEFPEWTKRSVYKITETIISGKTPKRADKSIWREGKTPWITSGDLHQKFIKTSKMNLNENGMKEYKMKLVPENSVLIGTAGQGKTRGTVAINKVAVATNDAMLAMVPSSAVDYRFLYLALDRKYEKIRLLSPKDSKTRLSTKMLGGVRVKMPVLQEQRKIADLLFSIEEAIQNEETVLKNFELLKKGYMRKMFD